MTNERRNTVADLFNHARKLPASERRTFLEQQCRDDPKLKTEVESLLAHEGETFLGSPDFLDRSGGAAPGEPSGEPPGSATEGGAGWSDSGPHPESFSGKRYLVQRLLGEGGQKQVFLARDSGLERDVVVAVLRQNCWDPENLARIRREARTMARLDDHPHIVSIYDFDEEDGQPYFVTQYVDGGSVADLLKSYDGAPLPIDRAIRIAEETAQALDHAHGQGIVHRDVKPANVLLTPAGTVKLGDFGLASSLDQSQLTRTGSAMGTATYMSPEHALGSDVGPLSDLYSLGAMLYEMVTGAPPFRGDSALSVISQHLNTAPIAPSRKNADIPDALDTIILQLLAKRSSDRPRSAEVLREALLAVPVGEQAPRSSVRQQPGLDSLASGVFVGREKEMEELRHGLEEAVAGRGQLFLLSGGPGSGKTRTAEELITYARLRNVEVLVGRCSEQEGAPAFWTWIQMLRSYCEARPAKEIVEVMGIGAADIAQLDPEVQGRMSEVELTQPRESDWAEPKRARFRLFDSLTSFFKNLSQRSPLLLVLDDLQWADEPSLRLLEFLSPELQDAHIMVLGSFREIALDRSHPLTRMLGEIARGGLARRVRLGGLSKEDVSRFIASIFGDGSWDALGSAVWKKSEGNPFFASEIVRLFVAEGQLAQGEARTSWVIEIPPAVQSVISRRLAQLSDDSHHVLTLAAVVGREFTLDVVERLSDFDGDRVIDALEEGTRHRVIDEVSAAIDRYVFTHDLIRETLSQDLSAARRARLHGRIGAILEDIYEETIGPHLAELAYHFSAAGTRGAVKACEYCGRAGDRSLQQLAYEEAVRYYTMALAALDHVGREDHVRRCRFLLDRGEVQRKLGDSDLALKSFRPAVESARRSGSAEQLAQVAMAIERTVWRSDHSAEPAVEVLRESLGALGDEDSALRAVCLGCLARALQSIGDSAEAVKRRQEAVEVARRVGDPSALMVILFDSLADWSPSHVESRNSLAIEMSKLAEQSGDLVQRIEAQSWLMMGFLQLGDVVEFKKTMRLHADLAMQTNVPVLHYVVAGYQAAWALIEGRFDEAETLALKARNMGERVLAENVNWIYGMQMFSIRREQGRLQEIAATVRTFVHQDPSESMWRPGLALVYAELDFRDEARNEFDALAARDFEDLPQNELWTTHVSYLSEVCCYLGDAVRARILYELLSPFAERNMVVGGSLACYGAVDRYLGELATTVGNLPGAEEHFERALAMNTRMGFKPWLAHTQHQYARMLLERDRTVDPERAGTLLDGALGISRELGMRTLEARVSELRDRGQP